MGLEQDTRTLVQAEAGRGAGAALGLGVSDSAAVLRQGCWQELRLGLRAGVG